MTPLKTSLTLLILSIALSGYSQKGQPMAKVALETLTEQGPRVPNLYRLAETERKEAVKRSRTQEALKKQYPTNKNLIKTAFGIIDKARTGYAMRMYEGRDFNLASVDFVTALRSKLPFVRVVQSPRDPFPRVFIRSGNRRSAIFDVDGAVYVNAPNFIQVTEVERIALIPSLVATAKYGSFASGGVIVVNTSMGTLRTEPGTNEPYDRVKLRDNYFKGDVLQETGIAKNAPNYLRALHSAQNEAEAIAIYKRKNVAYASSYFFTIDTYDYFLNRWNNRRMAQKVLDDHWSYFEGNPVALKALAYMYQKNNDHKQANALYKQIFNLRPDHAQSYLDMACSYRDIGEFPKAAAMHYRYNHLLRTGMLKEGEFTALMKREMNNLVRLHGKEFLPSRAYGLYTWKDDFEGTRLVFEWNDSEAEFALQFVNPEGQYYTWERSQMANADRIEEERQLGYSSEEYLIDGALKGDWQVNVKYKGNKRLTPAYIKATVYYHYGTPAQRQETKVFKMGIREVNQELFSVSNTPTVVAR
ncbi:hypothetical protein [Spongiimicrobium sp. 2-473A-2-J]|uniref:hypothetical protein n=1 Tax=Eudoraea algarum TaxID=3417568 RepID=UPI003D36ECDF